MTVPVFIHILSLDTIGGVETLYVHFLEKVLPAAQAVHVTSVCGKRPHPAFIQRFFALGHTPFLEEHLLGLRLPRWLRRIVLFR